MKIHEVRRGSQTPQLTSNWDAPLWEAAETLEIGAFRPESTDHRPRAQARLIHTPGHLMGIFRVEDQYVRSIQTGLQAQVCTDSCVECFLKPKPEAGHLNFEFNCGGAIRTSYITRPIRTADGFEEYCDLTDEDLGRVEVQTSMPPIVDPEITDPLTWTLAFAIPIDLLEKYVGTIGNPAGQEWRANFYKCGDDTSHPHWASWSPVAECDFHRPQDFGILRFEE